ncbi:SpoIID/LytB domain-containing protein [Acidobacteria bacterium ACD]|nr:MAG: SpoIID/LytB domain-containing protein [Acidobacteriota bacterium]MDL1948496.1 SpoIID/LytB domain-containing protein [Acidobacteria bacterium ACD]
MRRPPLAVLLALLSGLLSWAGEEALAGDVSRRVLRLSTGRVETVPLEAYVAAVLPGEIGSAPAAALQAQAVAARSYAMAKTGRHEDLGADLCDGVHCQVYRGPSAATRDSRRAAEATRGLVLAQRGRVIAAPFHSVCGGRTARPSDVWDDEETPDLPPVDDDACSGAPGSEWTFRLERGALGELGAALGLPGARFLEVFGHDGSGRVSMVRIVSRGGVSRVVRGFDFRRAGSELWGWATIRSTDFRVAGETATAYLLSGRGTGHGAGLCQRGAIRRAARGETRDGILLHYYRGTELTTLEALASAPPRRGTGEAGSGRR